MPIQLSENPGPGFHQVPIEGTTPDRIELSEAECDIDTLKKLKLGMRSTLWSRPNGNNQTPGGGGGGLLNVQPSSHPSDYSIAV